MHIILSEQRKSKLLINLQWSHISIWKTKHTAAVKFSRTRIHTKDPGVSLAKWSHLEAKSLYHKIKLIFELVITEQERFFLNFFYTYFYFFVIFFSPKYSSSSKAHPTHSHHQLPFLPPPPACTTIASPWINTVI